jgi:uncharacterized protein (DUF362 family)
MPKVSIVKVPEKPFDEEVYEAVRTAVDMIGGAQSFAKVGDKVLIKPNWWCWPSTSPRDSEQLVYGTTDRRVVLEAARLFVDLGCQVMIGEEPAVNRPVKKVYQGFKAEELARRAGAELVDLRAAGYRTVPAPLGREFSELRVSKIALDVDLMVNLPLMKSHMLTAVTLSLKNQKGIIPPVEKRAFHQRNLSQGVADLATVVKPGLIIVDAMIASTNWVIGGGLQPMGLILAGDNPVSTDVVCSHLMQADPYRIDHIRAASEMGVGEIDLDRIEVLGEEIDELSVPFALPADPLAIASELDNVEVLVGDTCSGCLNRLGEVFAKIGKENLAQSGDIAFVVGKDIAPVEGRTNILVGVCTARHKGDGIYLSDCPPMAVDVQQAIQYAAGEIAELTYFWDGRELATE